MPSSRAAVDTRRAASLSFAPPEPTAQPTAIRPAPRSPIPFAVSPGRAIQAAVPGDGGPLGAVSDYPIQIEKVQAPPLRDDILARDRLLDWLNVKVHHRVVLLTAEAGYGKTTLLADFARRTRLRVFWLRLDRGDRDWVGFVAYLVAAVREHQPEFGRSTSALLRQTGSVPPSLDVVLDTFLRELVEIGDAPSAFFFDDMHLVDDSDDVARVVNGLLSRGPERLTIVFASRQQPAVRLARLRSMGEVAELTRSDLRFDFVETGLLLRDESWLAQSTDLVGDVAEKTEGWPASLQLVRAALKDRDAATATAFVRSLSGAHGELYDYLAEEVVGVLPDELQSFLMFTSVLDVIDLPVATAATYRPADDVKRLMSEGRRQGLLTRVGQESALQARAHPLVREFLRSRLDRTVSPLIVQDIHRRVAVALEKSDWRRSAYHFFQSGDNAEGARILDASLPRILATGSFNLAAEILRGADPNVESSVTALVIEARLALQQGEAELAVSLALRALELDETSAATVTTLMAAYTATGDAIGGAAVARRFESVIGPVGQELARAYRTVLETSTTGSIGTALDHLRQIGRGAVASGSHRYAGVALTNEALLLKAAGKAALALRAANSAMEELELGSAHMERVAALLVRGWALAHLGDLEGGRSTVSDARAIASPSQHVEVAAEIAELEFYYGDPLKARSELMAAGELLGDGSDHAILMSCLLDAVAGDTSRALSRLDQLEPDVLRTTVAFEATRKAARALLSLLTGDPNAHALARHCATFAAAQGAGLWESYAALLAAAAVGGDRLSREVERVGARDAGVLSMAAEAIAPRLADLGPGALSVLAKEVPARPDRWRSLLRASVALEGQVDRSTAATFLAELGQPEDVLLLASIGRSSRDAGLTALSRTLARRLSPKVDVRDLGRVQIRIGERVVEGSQVRRKVLSLLCLLLTKVRFSASREDVTESLWPDLDPDDALNSLNQTVYFLRRLFEPAYREEISPGYVHQDGDTIWLDGELLDARSRLCRQGVTAIAGSPTVAEALSLLSLYDAPFALDFAYEEWAARYRDPLHASVLRVVEQALRGAAESRELQDAVALGEQAVRLEPDADELQLALIDLYRLTGAHAAAAEQYERYAATLKTLGVEAPPIDDLHRSVR